MIYEAWFPVWVRVARPHGSSTARLGAPPVCTDGSGIESEGDARYTPCTGVCECILCQTYSLLVCSCSFGTLALRWVGVCLAVVPVALVWFWGAWWEVV